jgi:aldehyde:ferredoxin oxidoreductase
LAGVIDRNTTEGKAALYIDYEDRLTIFNTMILCVFYRDMLQWPKLQTLIKALTGIDYTVEELHRMANEIITMTHEFNQRQGLGRDSDRLPKRMHQEPLPETGAIITEAELTRMVDDYYTLRGWE